MEFTVDGHKYKIADISQKDQSEAKIHQNRALQTALDQGMQLNAEVDMMLESRGLLNPTAESDKIEQLQKQIADMTVTLKKGVRNGQRMTKEEGRELAIAIRNKRRELSRVGDSVTGYYDGTADSYARNEWIQYLIYATTIDVETGRRHWSAYDTFKSDFGSDNPVSKEATTNFLRKLYNVDSDSENAYYENKWLRRMSFMDDKFRLVDSKNRLVDDKGRLIDEDGYFVNESGNRVDKFGNLLDDKGQLLVEDGWDTETSPTLE